MPRSALGVILVLSLFSQPTAAQTTFAAITGTVRDSAGAVVPGVAIEAVHSDSNYRYTVISNETGNYTLPQLREGAYVLRATLPGFREFVARGIQLASRDERRVDIILEVGGVSSSIEITAGPALIETETARIGDSKDADQLKSLPLNTRSLYNFLALSPGVVAAGGGESFRRFCGKPEKPVGPVDRRCQREHRPGRYTNHTTGSVH
jgi:Carboxypeptidase regulatory-like domain